MVDELPLAQRVLSRAREVLAEMRHVAIALRSNFSAPGSSNHPAVTDRSGRTCEGTEDAAGGFAGETPSSSRLKLFLLLEGMQKLRGLVDGVLLWRYQQLSGEATSRDPPGVGVVQHSAAQLQSACDRWVALKGEYFSVTHTCPGSKGPEDFGCCVDRLVEAALLGRLGRSRSSSSVGAGAQQQEIASALRVTEAALREEEASLDTQARLLGETHRLMESSGYSESNFAYGSTPFSSFVRLFSSVEELPPGEEPGAPHARVALRAALERCASSGEEQASPLRFTVFGSSMGWLLFYARLALGLPNVVGYELLPCLVDISRYAPVCTQA